MDDCERLVARIIKAQSALERSASDVLIVEYRRRLDVMNALIEPVSNLVEQEYRLGKQASTSKFLDTEDRLSYWILGFGLLGAFLPWVGIPVACFLLLVQAIGALQHSQRKKEQTLITQRLDEFEIKWNECGSQVDFATLKTLLNPGFSGNKNWPHAQRYEIPTKWELFCVYARFGLLCSVLGERVGEGKGDFWDDYPPVSDVLQFTHYPREVTPDSPEPSA